MQRLTTILLLAGISFTAQAQTNCGLLHDINNNGSVDIEDFLSILGLFGDQDSDGDGLYDSQDACIDLAACNFMEVDAQFCFYPDAIGDCNGNCPLDADGDGVCDLFSCGSSVDYQGYDYTTVFIGGQCWFAENLRSENYNNGDEISSNLSDGEWGNTSSGAVAVYNEDVANLETYGRLYNWYAVDDARGLCPIGWHVPTDGEWTELTDHLGGESVAGGQMKTDYGWSGGGNGTDSSSFSGLPGGNRLSTGDFSNAGDYGWWWSSSPYNGISGWVRYLHSSWENVIRTNGNPRAGFSVRCIQDSE